MLQGVFEHLASKGEQQPQLTGLQILVEGRVPLGRGLPHPPYLVFRIFCLIWDELPTWQAQSWNASSKVLNMWPDTGLSQTRLLCGAAAGWKNNFITSTAYFYLCKAG